MMASMAKETRTIALQEYRTLPHAGSPAGRPAVRDLLDLAELDLERLPLAPRDAKLYRAFIAKWRRRVATVRRAASAARKTRGAGPGRPAGSKSDKPRCPCGAHTLRRAQARAYDCCKAAGLRIVS